MTVVALPVQRIQAYDKATGLNAVRTLTLDLRSLAAEKDRQLQAVGHWGLVIETLFPGHAAWKPGNVLPATWRVLWVVSEGFCSNLQASVLAQYKYVLPPKCPILLSSEQSQQWTRCTHAVSRMTAIRHS